MVNIIKPRTGTSTPAAGDFNAVGEIAIDTSAQALYIKTGASTVKLVGSPAVGSTSIVTTGALDAGSITSGFGNIDIGSSTFDTTGAVSTGNLTANGISIGLGDASSADDTTITFNSSGNDGVFKWDQSADKFEFSDGIQIVSNASLNFRDGNSYIHSNDSNDLRVVGTDIDLSGSAKVILDTPIVELLDDGVITEWGAHADITLKHVHNTGLTLTHHGSTDDLPLVFKLKSEEDAIIADETLARIDFEAGDADGSDALLPAASIAAVADAAFSATDNSTRLSFGLGESVSSVGRECFRMDHDGHFYLIQDSSILKFGADSDTTLTHVADAGLLLNSTRQLQFGDSGTYIHQSADGVLDLVSDTEIELTATTIDMNGALDLSGNLTLGGNIVCSGDFTVDSEADLILDANGSNWVFKDGGAGKIFEFIQSDTGAVTLQTNYIDKDVFIKLNDGGSTITALTLDASEAGAATFNSTITTTGFVLDGNTITGVDDSGEFTDDDAHMMTSAGVNDRIEATMLTLTADHTISGDSTYSGDNSFTGTNTIGTNNKLQFRDSGLYISSNADGDLDIVSDGTAVDSINIESAGGITLDAGTAASGIVYEDDGTEMARLYNSSSDVILETKVSDKDFSIKGNDGGSAITALTLDMSEAGAATFNNKITAVGTSVFTNLDISGDVDIDGTTNLDAVDIDGTVQIDGATTFGADDTGVDVKFFGATASAYLLWDESADKLLTAGGAVVDIVKDKLLIGGTAVTTTAAELNVLDAVTAGTVTASLGVVVDSNKDIGTFRNITLSGELDAGSLDVSGNADIDGTLEADAITVDGTALNEYIADTVGAMVGSNTETGITVTYEDGDNTLDFAIGTLNQDTTGTADNITVSANNSTDETVYPIFVDGATGSQGAESDTGLTYNPSSGLLTTTLLAGTLNTAAQANVTSLGTLTTLTVDNVIVNGTTIGHTDDTDLITLADGVATVAGVVDITDATDSSDATGDTGALRTEGGASIAKKLYVGTDLDVDGTTNLDAVDIDGAVQIDGTITVGANDQGYDVIFYGDTASANVTWDTSADDLIFNGGAGLIVPDGQLTLGSTAISSTAAEINLIDGGTARGTTAVASGDGILINDGGTMRMTNVDTVSTYFASHSVGGGNIVTTGALNSGSITSGFGAIDIGSSALSTTGSVTLGATSFGDNAITNVGSIALDSISCDNTANAITFSHGVVPNTVTEAASGNYTPDMSQYTNFILTVSNSNNCTLQDPTDETAGQSGIFVFIQDGTGGGTLSHADDRYYVAGGSSITLSTGANAIDIVPYFVQADGKIHLGAAQKAFSEA